MELILYFWGKDQKMAESSSESIIWKGKFSYNPEEYGFEEDVNFELYISKTDNQFEGVSYDDEFRDLLTSSTIQTSVSEGVRMST